MFKVKKLYPVLLSSLFASCLSGMEVTFKEPVPANIDGTLNVFIKSIEEIPLPTKEFFGGLITFLSIVALLNENRKDEDKKKNLHIPTACAVLGLNLLFSKQIGQLFTSG